jgi:alpha-tubulin suppressor-like RCC1 family protein
LHRSPPNSGFVAVATGNYHSMGLRSDGTIAAWGMCDVEQCDVPVPNSGFTAIAAGDSHSLALRQDRSIAAWGSNEQGQLAVPQPNTGFVAISAGLLHSLALRSDGSIVGWGRNVSGETIPPAPNTDWVAISAGGYTSMGLKSDGSIHKWGCGGPCELPSPNTGFVAIATNFDHSLALRADGAIAAWGRIDQDYVPLPNDGYQAVTGNWGLADALKSVDGDSDEDGMPDELDCAPADMMAFAMPGEVRAVRFDTRTLLSWRPETGRSGPGTTIDIVRGALSGFPVEPASGESCVDDGLFVNSFTVTSVPAPGTGAYILVRAANNCGTGSYGFASSGTERTTGVCP